MNFTMTGQETLPGIAPQINKFKASGSGIRGYNGKIKIDQMSIIGEAAL